MARYNQYLDDTEDDLYLGPNSSELYGDSGMEGPENDGSRRSTDEDPYMPGMVGVSQRMVGAPDAESLYDDMPAYTGPSDGDSDVPSSDSRVAQAAQVNSPKNYAKERAAFDEYMELKSHPPTERKPKMWQKIAAMAVGGAGGFVNAGGRVPHIDTSQAVEGILHGNYQEDYKKWQDRVAVAGKASDAENKRNLDLNQIEHMKNEKELNEARNARWKAEGANNEIKANAATVTADARKEAMRIKKEHETYVEGEQARKAKWVEDQLKVVDGLNLPPAAKELVKANIASGGKGAQLRVDSRNTGADVLTGVIDPKTGAKSIADREAARVDEIKSKTKLNDARAAHAGDRAASKGGASTPEEKARAVVAKIDIGVATREIAQADAELRRLADESRKNEAVIEAYKKRDPKKQLDQAAKQKLDLEYELAIQKNNKIHHGIDGKPSEVDRVMASKKAAYDALKRAQQGLMPQVQMPTLQSNGLPQVTMPPPASPKRVSNPLF